MSYSMVYVTAKDEEEAKEIANHLLDKHLIACANMFPIKSLYWWKGKIEAEDEIVLIMKTQKKNSENIISQVKAVHSYEVPCIEFFHFEEGNPEYLEWIKKETTQP
ncbi:MAG: divalent-cation tolerance protein CutA [Thermoplasmata archaeon]|nr:MAG: divalent-cation tolerance protein CutA [Thermoplasmata archaeon]